MAENITVNFRRFTSSDWMGMAGAERFTDGSEPLVANTDLTVDGWSAEAIIDANGASVMLFDTDGETIGFWAGGSATSIVYLLTAETVTAQGLANAGFTEELEFING